MENPCNKLLWNLTPRKMDVGRPVYIWLLYKSPSAKQITNSLITFFAITTTILWKIHIIEHTLT